MLENQKGVKLKLCFLIVFSLFLLGSSVGAVAQTREEYESLKDIIFQASGLTDLQKDKLFTMAKRAIEINLPKKDIEKIIKDSLNMGTDPEDLGELISLLIEAKSSDTPVLPLINKTKEGLLKGVDIKRIVEIIKTGKEKLFLAKSILSTVKKDLRLKDVNRASEELVLFEERGIDLKEAQMILNIAAEKRLSFYEVREGFEACLDFQEKGLPQSLITREAIKGFSEGKSTREIRAVISTKEKWGVSDISFSPNPFSPNADGVNDTTTIAFSLWKEATIGFAFYDEDDHLATILPAKTYQPGVIQEVWDGRDYLSRNLLAKGNYTLILEGKTFSSSSFKRKAEVKIRIRY